MSSYLPPTENLPRFNPGVFQSGTTEGITLSEADSRFVKKSGSIMTGALSTPSLQVDSIDVETEINKISSLEQQTTDITFAGTTTTIANDLDIEGILSTPNIANLQSDILTNNSKVGISTAQVTEIGKISTLEQKTTDITFAGTTTTIANNLDIPGTLSTVNFADLNSAVFTNSLKVGVSTAQASEITANTAKIATLGSAYISWDNNSVSNNIWGNNNRLDTLTTTYKKIGAITLSENATRSGAVDFDSGTYRISVNATVTPRQTGSISVPFIRADFRLYISFKDVNIATFTDDEIGTYGSGFIRNANSHDQGYGTNIGFESLQYFGSNTELSIKTQIYDNATASAATGYAAQYAENTMHVWCLMVVEKIASTDITTEVTW